MSELMKEAWDALDTGVVALERTILRLLLARQAIPYQQPKPQNPQPEKKEGNATENMKRNRKHVPYKPGVGALDTGAGALERGWCSVTAFRVNQTREPIPATETSKSST